MKKPHLAKEFSGSVLVRRIFRFVRGTKFYAFVCQQNCQCFSLSTPTEHVEDTAFLKENVSEAFVIIWIPCIVFFPEKISPIVQTVHPQFNIERRFRAELNDLQNTAELNS